MATISVEYLPSQPHIRFPQRLSSPVIQKGNLSSSHHKEEDWLYKPYERSITLGRDLSRSEVQLNQQVNQLNLQIEEQKWQLNTLLLSYKNALIPHSHSNQDIPKITQQIQTVESELRGLRALSANLNSQIQQHRMERISLQRDTAINPNEQKKILNAQSFLSMKQRNNEYFLGDGEKSRNLQNVIIANTLPMTPTRGCTQKDKIQKLILESNQELAESYVIFFDQLFPERKEIIKESGLSSILGANDVWAIYKIKNQSNEPNREVKVVSNNGRGHNIRCNIDGTKIFVNTGWDGDTPATVYIEKVIKKPLPPVRPKKK